VNEAPLATIHADVEEILLTEDQIQARVAELGAQLTADYAGLDPVLISVLKGSIVFLADLVRGVELPLSIDIMEVSSYGAATETSGQVRILKDLSKPIEGRDVIIVEDIIDTGRTLDYLRRNLATRHPRRLAICALLDKVQRREVDIPLDYVGFVIPDRFVVGYGFDWTGHFRGLRNIHVLEGDPDG
jgi:hypoxanthine phosphoribosyltransferase